MIYQRQVKADTEVGLASGSAIPEDVFFGRTPEMQLLRRRVTRVAGIDVPVLIHGDSGTGKSVLAAEIHSRSPWRDGPFVPLNCAAIPGTLLESELFGYEAGAFTGAHSQRIGWVQMAASGTLFLDEIADMSMPLQAKLLHLLQDRRFCRIGGREELEVQTRIICATNRDLAEEVHNGCFREDLFYRINAMTLYLPPLAERRQDIAELVNYFLGLYAQRYNTRPRPVAAHLMSRLLDYRWPGNIRELENVIKTYAVLDTEEAITSALTGRRPIPVQKVEDSGDPVSLKDVARQATREVERKMIEDALNANNWNRKAAARVLNISYRSLFYKIRAAGLPPKKAVARPVAVAEPTRASQRCEGADSEK